MQFDSTIFYCKHKKYVYKMYTTYDIKMYKLYDIYIYDIFIILPFFNVYKKL